MKCPRQSVLLRDRSGSDYWELGDCLGPECAWWNPGIELCSIRTASWNAAEAIAMAKRAIEIVSEPHATFTCHDCGVRVTLEIDAELKVPYDWKRQEQVDGKLVWVCPQCLEGRK